MSYATSTVFASTSEIYNIGAHVHWSAWTGMAWQRSGSDERHPIAYTNASQDFISDFHSDIQLYCTIPWLHNHIKSGIIVEWAKSCGQLLPCFDNKVSKSQITQIRDIDVFRLDSSMFYYPSLVWSRNTHPAERSFKSRHHDYCIDVNVNWYHMTDTFCLFVCDQFVIGWDIFKNFNLLTRPVKNKWWDVMVPRFMHLLWERTSYGALKVYKIWLPWFNLSTWEYALVNCSM